MTYNPYDDLKQIYNYKSAYNKAKNANDTAGMQAAQSSAKSHYDSLRSNGYSAYADQMSGYTEQQAADFVNSYSSKTPQGTQGGVPKFTASAIPKAASDLTAAAKNAVQTVPGAYKDITPELLGYITGVVDNKVLYDNAKFVDGTGDYQQYADAAQPFYQSLRNAGRNDIADLLGASDTETALEYLRGTGIELDPAKQDMNAIMNNFLTQPSHSSNVG